MGRHNKNFSISSGNGTADPLSVHAGVNEIISRVNIATTESPIAVFRIPQFQTSNLVAVFASTVKTMKLIKRNKAFIGLFDNSMDILEVKIKLDNASQL